MYQYSLHRNTAEALSNLSERIKNGQAIKLPGIRKKIADKIEEFLETGTHKELEQVIAGIGIIYMIILLAKILF